MSLPPAIRHCSSAAEGAGGRKQAHPIWSLLVGVKESHWGASMPVVALPGVVNAVTISPSSSCSCWLSGYKPPPFTSRLFYHTDPMQGTVTTQDGGSNQQVRERTQWGGSEKDVKEKEQYAHVFSHPQHCGLVLQQKSVPHRIPCCPSTLHEGGGDSPKLSPDRLLTWLKAGKSEIIKHSPDSPSDSLL